MFALRNTHKGLLIHDINKRPSFQTHPYALTIDAGGAEIDMVCLDTDFIEMHASGGGCGRQPYIQSVSRWCAEHAISVVVVGDTAFFKTSEGFDDTFINSDTCHGNIAHVIFHLHIHESIDIGHRFYNTE